MHPFDLKTNHCSHALGIDTFTPEFSWKISAKLNNVLQSAYQIQVSNDERFEAPLSWDSGRVVSAQQWGVTYQGSALQSATRYYWRVLVWDQCDERSQFSDIAWFETSLLDTSQWQANWISSCKDEEDDIAALYLRGDLELSSPVISARAYVSALGWYRLFINGQDCTGNALVPRWTPLDQVVEYQTYDVTAHFREGKNIVAMAIGDGRYRGHLSAFNHRAVYGNRLAGFAQIDLKLAGGSSRRFATDEQWLAGNGRIISSDPKFGEQVDLRISDHDWLCEEKPPTRFFPAQKMPPHPRQLIAEAVPRVEEIDRLKPRRIFRSPSGKQIVDFGQNFAGFARIKLTGFAGEQIQLTFSELLSKAGEIEIGNFLLPMQKAWHQRDRIILNGEPTWFEPWFTIHGFRYMEVEGLDYTLTLADIEGIVISSNLQISGTFECSDARLNQLHRNTLWSLRSNFVDTPTDCPTRERGGWTGDIQVFAPTATTFVDAHAFLIRYLKNLALEQLPTGIVPVIIPAEASAFSGGIQKRYLNFSTSAGWGDAAVMLPWTLYRYYGDQSVLRRQYGSMKKWVDYQNHAARQQKGLKRYLRKRTGELENYIVESGFHFGEWMRPGESFFKAMTKARLFSSVVATAYFFNSTKILSSIAKTIGEENDARHYKELSNYISEAWRAAFVHDDGRIGRDEQDDYVRALAFGLLTDKQKPAAVARLVQLIENANHHVGTGFLSTSMLLFVLAENGRADIAYRLLLQTISPSWLAQIERGATTIWETWEGYDKAGNGKASHNHYSLGAVVCWLHEGVAGLSAIEPGYRRIRIAPHIGGELSFATSILETPLGKASSAWKIDEGIVTLDISIPPGSEAEVHLGNSATELVGSGEHRFTWRS